MSGSQTEPNLLAYSNYRVYLKDYYEYRKRRSPAFSFRAFALKAGLPSPNYYKLVMDGKRNLSKRSITHFLKGLGLTGRQAEFFENLVFFNQSRTLAERTYFYERLLKSRVRGGLRRLEEQQFQIFSEWHHAVIREMVLLADFRNQAAWISKRLRKRVTPKQAEESLRLLLSLGLLKKTANGYAQADVNITTSDEVRSLSVRTFHDRMIQLALRAMDEVPGPERDISSVTLAIRWKDFPRLKEQLQLMRKELLNLAAEGGEAEEVVQINMQLFPLTAKE